MNLELSTSRSDWKKSKTSIGWKNKNGAIHILCPFHDEKTPSCVIHTRTPKFFHCFGCGKSGGIRELLRRSKNTKRVLKKYVIYKYSDQYALDNPEFPF
jgi:hypothetical protein